METKVVGTSHVRVDGLEKVTGTAQYAVDVNMPGMLYGKILRSPYPHARIVSVDKRRALVLEGVQAVISAEDVPRIRHFGAPAPRTVSLVADQYIFDEKVRFVGDGVAAVAAVSEEIAEEALDLIEVTYEQLPAVYDPEEAMQPEAPPIHDLGRPGNEVMEPIRIERGDIEAGFAEADYIFEGIYRTGRSCHAYMEPNACVCHFDHNGRLTVWSSTQCAFMVRGILSEVLDIPEHKIRVLVEHMGGGFGAKQDLYQHEFICALLAKKTGRPVKMEYTRKETFLAGKTRHPVTVYLKQGVKKDGTLTAREARYVSNTGAYASHGPGVTAVGCIDLTSLYRCLNLKIEGRSYYTNTPLAGAFRGYGAVQAFFALDAQMDEIAAGLGLDPLEVRLKNAVREGDLSPSGHHVHGDSLAACLRRGAEEVQWQAWRQKNRSDDGAIRRGWGIGTEMHSSGAYPDIKEQSNAVLQLNANGTVNLLTGVADLGTGARTVMAQIAAEELGIPFKSVHVVNGDTDTMPFDIGAYASHTTYVGGGAVKKAAEDLKRQLLELASDQLEVAAEDLVVQDGQIVVRGVPDSAVNIGELVAGHESYAQHTLIASAKHEPTVAYSFAAHFVRVAVDTVTGQVQVEKVIAVHEVGKAVNPRAVEGQIEGGIQQGIGHSLTEDLVIDRNSGRALNASFVDYKMPLSMDMPEIKSIILELQPDPTAPFGAKGVGEDPIIPIGPAIANAVYDAIGVRIRELPITPDKVLQALKEKRE